MVLKVNSLLPDFFSPAWCRWYWRKILVKNLCAEKSINLYFNLLPLDKSSKRQVIEYQLIPSLQRVFYSHTHTAGVNGFNSIIKRSISLPMRISCSICQLVKSLHGTAAACSNRGACKSGQETKSADKTDCFPSSHPSFEKNIWKR